MAEKQLHDPAASIMDASRRVFTIEGVGDVVIRRPKGKDIVEIGRRATLLSGGISLTEPTAFTLVQVQCILAVLAEEKVAVDIMEAYDFEPYFTFYGRYTDWLASFSAATTTPAAA